MTNNELINDIQNNLLTYDINLNQAKADRLSKELKKLDNKIKYINKKRSKIPMFEHLTWKNHYILLVIKTLIFILSLILGIHIKAIIFLLLFIIVTTSIEDSILFIIDDNNYELEDLMEEYNLTKEEYDNAAMKAYQLTKKQNKYRESQKQRNLQPHVSIPNKQKPKKLQLNSKKVYR